MDSCHENGERQMTQPWESCADVGQLIPCLQFTGVDNRLIFGDNLLALKALGWWAVDKIRESRRFLCKLALRLAARYNTLSSTHAPCLSSARMMHIKGAFFYFLGAVPCGEGLP